MEFRSRFLCGSRQKTPKLPEMKVTRLPTATSQPELLSAVPTIPIPPLHKRGRRAASAHDQLVASRPQPTQLQGSPNQDIDL